MTSSYKIKLLIKNLVIFRIKASLETITKLTRNT
jgi:hypothetical protein